MLFRRDLLKEVFTIRVKDLPLEVREVLVEDIDHTESKRSKRILQISCNASHRWSYSMTSRLVLHLESLIQAKLC